MSASAYPINSTIPIPIYPGGKQAPVTLYNQDTTDTIYISDVGSGLSGFPLGAGDTITWDGEKPLYAWTTAGASAQLIVLDNGGSITSARAIADQIIEAGLAQDVANAIVASSLAGDTASSIQIAGVPTIDDPAVLLNASVTSASYLAVLDVSRYQSVTVYITGTNGSNSKGEINLGWQTASNDVLWQDKFLFAMGSHFPVHEIEAPSIGERLYLAIDQYSGQQDFSVRVVGSYRPVSQLRSVFSSGLWPDFGSVRGGNGQDNFWRASIGTVAASGVSDNYPAFRPGLCSVFFYTNSGAGSDGRFYILDYETSSPMYAAIIPAATSGFTVFASIVLPRRQPLVRVQAGTGGLTSAQVTMSYEER